MDTTIFDAIQSIGGRSDLFDRAICNIATNPLLKGALPMIFFWALWFAPSYNRMVYRARLLAMLVVAAVAIVIGRAMATLLPFRLRPLHDPDIKMQLSFDLDPSILSGWSAFPSDHAVMFFALSTCFFLIQKRIGYIAFVHSIIAIAFARVFLGFHWPSDVLAGALVGAGVAMVLFRPVAKLISQTQLTRWLIRREQFLYPALFIITYQVTTMFNATRELASAMLDALSLV
ncbi:phosphatase PAP2 family protein [Cognatishimia activa]|uniref:phosphatase PAP2 family protein n=1 Tax=Cognatishimia activa TaxID=1715691 RepID=UPI00222F3A07|nr:phosphatase PAP2 family protein [Cognatishimia activa]UZD90087.1 phosphatase PAP2 family protein [Cognatishimia activa]